MQIIKIIIYLRDPEAVEILQQFEGIVQLALGQVLRHPGGSTPEEFTPTSPKLHRLLSVDVETKPPCPPGFITNTHRERERGAKMEEVRHRERERQGGDGRFLFCFLCFRGG